MKLIIGKLDLLLRVISLQTNISNNIKNSFSSKLIIKKLRIINQDII